MKPSLITCTAPRIGFALWHAQMNSRASSNVPAYMCNKVRALACSMYAQPSDKVATLVLWGSPPSACQGPWCSSPLDNHEALCRTLGNCSFPRNHACLLVCLVLLSWGSGMILPSNGVPQPSKLQHLHRTCFMLTSDSCLAKIRTCMAGDLFAAYLAQIQLSGCICIRDKLQTWLSVFAAVHATGMRLMSLSCTRAGSAATSASETCCRHGSGMRPWNRSNGAMWLTSSPMVSGTKAAYESKAPGSMQIAAPQCFISPM
eukprot:1157969-Pelagomonas_calceolata.AAC.17